MSYRAPSWPGGTAASRAARRRGSRAAWSAPSPRRWAARWAARRPPGSGTACRGGPGHGAPAPGAAASTTPTPSPARRTTRAPRPRPPPTQASAAARHLRRRRPSPSIVPLASLSQQLPSLAEQLTSRNSYNKECSSAQQKEKGGIDRWYAHDRLSATLPLGSPPRCYIYIYINPMYKHGACVVCSPARIIVYSAFGTYAPDCYFRDGSTVYGWHACRSLGKLGNVGAVRKGEKKEEAKIRLVLIRWPSMLVVAYTSPSNWGSNDLICSSSLGLEDHTHGQKSKARTCPRTVSPRPVFSERTPF